MAEIKIQRKKSRAWIWLLLLIVAIVLIWLYFESIDNDIEEVNLDDTYETEEVMEQDYVMFLDTLDTNLTARSDEMQEFVDSDVDVQNYYVLNGLRSLSASLNAIVNNQDISESQLRTERNDLDKAVSEIDRDTSNIALYKEGITSAASLMKSIQKKLFPNMQTEVDSVVSSAEKITGSVPFDEQQQEVKNFFDKANKVVQNMRQDFSEPAELEN